MTYKENDCTYPTSLEYTTYKIGKMCVFIQWFSHQKVISREASSIPQQKGLMWPFSKKQTVEHEIQDYRKVTNWTALLILHNVAIASKIVVVMHNIFGFTVELWETGPLVFWLPLTKTMVFMKYFGKLTLGTEHMLCVASKVQYCE